MTARLYAFFCDFELKVREVFKGKFNVLDTMQENVFC